MKRLWLLAIGATLILALATPTYAYLKLGIEVNGRQIPVKWNQTPVRYLIENRGIPGVTASDFQAAVGRAFTTWEVVSTSTVTYQFAGLTTSNPGALDGQSTLGFMDRPDLDRVLASTSFIVNTVTGDIVESDILFNSAFPWSVAPAGTSGQYDLESIALHEIGHLSGLSHSAIGETELRVDGGRRILGSGAVMFPIAFPAGNIDGRTLRADDIAGISDVYPAQGFTAETGSVSGRVTKNGTPVAGAHVVAFDLGRGSLVGNFTLNAQGEFSIAGLSPGPHVMRVEPLDDASPDSFFSGSTPVDTDFRVGFFDRLVVVPAGGDSGAIEVKVLPK